ncbi:hypothetical protein BGZ70_006995 [Mortierella alpina]|uniref:Cyclin N-terminal domain-containing protein n=1 Tax=Mortierella alpina TaxID=64518 RepID=A0A9P6M3E1_MORAP|nr:hypothetical protein BGZ70_006995 [Mortierella alpina]
MRKYKHIFQNRPINNINSTNANNHSSTSITSNDNGHYEIYTYDETATDDNVYFDSNNQHYITPRTSFPESINQQGNRRLATASSTLLSELEEAEEKTERTMEVEYAEQDRLLAKEQLRIVRRNLRTCSPQSLYFRRFAALADDWRNFLPQTRAHYGRSEDRYYDARSSVDFDVDSGDEYSVNDLNSDSEDGEKIEAQEDDLLSVSISLPPIMQHDIYSRTQMTSRSPSRSSIQHTLQASRPSCLASSILSTQPAHPTEGTRHNGSNGREAGSTSVTFQVEDLGRSSGVKHARKNDYKSLQDENDFYDALFLNDIPALGSTSHISLVSSISASSTQDADDTDANDADADEDDNCCGSSSSSSSSSSNINTSALVRSAATVSRKSRRSKPWLQANPSRTSHHVSDKMIVAERRAHELARRSIQQQRLAKATARSGATALPVATAETYPSANIISPNTTSTATTTSITTTTMDEPKGMNKAQKRVRSNEIRRLGVSAFTTTSIKNRHSRRRNLHQPLILPPPARFWEIRIEDIVRGIETQFTLGSEEEVGADVDEYGNENGSVDSLTSLVSAYEDSDVHAEEEEEKEEQEQVTGKGREETTQDTEAEAEAVRRIAPLENESRASTSGSTVSTLCDVAAVEASHAGSLVTAATALPVQDHPGPDEQPPQYLDHELDQVVFILPPGTEYESISDRNQTLNTGAISLLDSQNISEKHIVEEEKALTHSNSKISTQTGASQVRPSLTLQTLTHTMGAGIAPGPLSAVENKGRPLGSQHSLTKCNSTSSLYIDSTMAKSDVDETLRAVATILYEKVLQSHRMNDCRTERIINSSSYMPSERVMMTQADIFDFMRFIFDCGQNLGPENAIITLIYVERITELGDLSFHAINWRRLLLGALILSIKVWEDLAVFNSDVCAIFEGLAVKDVNALERFSMAKLQYNVSVKRSLYAAYYFRLRDVSEQEYNLHYGRLTLSMSQRDMQTGPSGTGSHCALSSSSSSSMARNDSHCSNGHSRRSGSQAGLAGMGMAMAMGMVGHGRGGSHIPQSSHTASTHHSKVPVGPGYRKWTLKPLSVREADRLEARSSVYCSNMMMEKQERKDVGCCWDEYSHAYASGLTTPAEELYNLSASLLAAASSMHTIASLNSTLTAGSGPSTHYHRPHPLGSSSSSSADAMLSKSTSVSSNVTKASVSGSDRLGPEDGHLKGGGSSGHSNSKSGDGGAAGEGDDKTTVHPTDPPRRVLRLKKSRSDFFFQNSTPASIM